MKIKELKCAICNDTNTYRYSINSSLTISVTVNVNDILAINLVILCRYICISWPTHTTFGLRLCLFHISKANELRRIVNQYERLSRIYSRLKFLFPMVVARLAVDTTHKVDS